MAYVEYFAKSESTDLATRFQKPHLIYVSNLKFFELPTFAYLIPHIIFVGAEKKMFGAAAFAIITTM